MYLEDLVITDKLRGKGIGRLLFDKLIEECHQKKYSGMAWQVLDWNEPAINFYKKFKVSINFPKKNVQNHFEQQKMNFSFTMIIGFMELCSFFFSDRDDFLF